MSDKRREAAVLALDHLQELRDELAAGDEVSEIEACIEVENAMHKLGAYFRDREDEDRYWP